MMRSVLMLSLLPVSIGVPAIDLAPPGQQTRHLNSDTVVAIQELRDFLDNTEPAYEVGVLDSPEKEVFGDIVDGVFDSKGRLLILDGHRNSIRVFDSDGTFLQEMGRQGGGPGEFLRPEEITVGPEGDLYVIDGRQGRLSIFRKMDSGYEYSESFSTSATSRSFCRMGSYLYIAGGGSTEKSMVQVYSLDGEKLDEFGSVTGGNPIVREAHSEGHIGCSEAESAVVLATARTGRLHAFTARGDSLWSGALKGFRAQSITPTPRGASYKVGPEGIDVTRSVVPWFGGTLVAQTEYYGLSNRSGTASEDAYNTYAFTATSGLQVKLSEPLPRILAQNSDFLALSLESPFPRVLVYDLSGR